MVTAFRNCQVAAPLKRSPGMEVAAGRPLPQLSSCGPIEAVRRDLCLGGDALLPQLSSCGPIEARLVVIDNLGYPAPSATVKLRPH